MTNYYKYDFISAGPLIAQISEELKSYLETGAVDSAIWSLYINDCLRKLGKGSLEIKPLVLEVCNYEARLPDDFVSAREVWLCTNDTKEFQLPGADYQEVTMGSTSTMLSTTNSYCTPCADCCTPDVIKAVYKTTHQAFAYYKKQYLLKPGNIHTRSMCTSCNLSSNVSDTFDIVGNKIVTNFTSGNIYLLYYSEQFDSEGYPMIPNNYRIEKFIEDYIKARVFEQLSNQVTDETYNQIQQKADKYERKADESFIMADIESKKQTAHKRAELIKRERHLNDKYLIP